MADTLTINVRDIRYSNTVHVRIPIINKTNPCFGYDATEDQIRQLMSIPNYEIRDAATGVIINGHNLQEYFPSGGGGGGEVTPQIVQSMINASIDSTVSETSTKAVQNAAITNFVNSSIESSTADFKGTYDSKAEMNEVTANQNDYAFLRVLNNDGSVNHYERYKWSNNEVSGSHWLFEYNVNNSSFTAEQWAAINSGIKDTDVSALGGHVNNTNNPHNVTKSQVGLSDVDNTSDADKPISTATQTALNTKFDTAGTGLNKNGTTVSHATPEGAATHVKAFYKFSTDALGHVNGVTEATEAEVDAIDSGITAEKVGQIETNKNNILYNTNAGFLRKNFYDLVGAVYTGNGAYYKGDDSITVYTTGGAWKKIESVLNAPSGSYKLKFKISNYSSSGGPIQINTYTNDVAETLISRSIITGNGEYAADVEIPAQGAKIAFGINYSSDATVSNSITVSECMLYSAEISDSTYQPYALSNTVITPALKECVDNGVKNVLDFANLGSPIVSHVTYTKTATDITCTSNDSWAYIMFPFSLVSGNYNLSFLASNYSKSGGVIRVTLYTDSTATTAVDTKEVTGNGSYNFDFTWIGGTLYLGIYVNQSGTSYTNTVTIGQIMICTQAEYNISPTYQPHALSNTAITPALVECVDNGAKNLLNVTKVETGNITFTPDNNGYVTASPNNTDTRSWTYASSQYKVYLKPATYVCVLDIKTASSRSELGVSLRNTSNTAIFSSTPSDLKNKTGIVTFTFTIETAGSYGLIIKQYEMVARYMICEKSLYDVSPTYQPHALSNAELTTHITPTQLAQLPANGTTEFVASQYNTICLILANNTNHKTASTTLPAIFFSYGFEICAEVDSAQCRALKSTGNTYTVTVPSGYTVYIYGY